MMRKAIRVYGLLFGGIFLFVGGGLTVIYGILFFYVVSPGGAVADQVVGPLNRLLASLVANQVFVALAAIGMSVFLLDVSQNGLLDLDDRLYVEKKKDWRRQKAAESEAWDPPAEDQESPTVYDELIEQVESDDLAMTEKQAHLGATPSIRGAVRNTSSQTYEDVSVTVRFYDDDGEAVATRMPATKKLKPASTWTFEAFCNTDSAAISAYEVSPPEGDTVE